MSGQNGVSKDELKNFKSAKKGIERQYDVEVTRREEVVLVNGVYSFTFGDENEKPLSIVEMETAMIKTIEDLNSQEERAS